MLIFVIYYNAYLCSIRLPEKARTYFKIIIQTMLCCDGIYQQSTEFEVISPVTENTF